MNQAQQKHFDNAEVAMELAYRSFLPKLRVELVLFEGGLEPPKYAIKMSVMTRSTQQKIP